MGEIIISTVKASQPVTQDILITGGTGSFGHAFASLLLSHLGIGRIIIFSRDELKQHKMRLHFMDNQRMRYFVGDVRDESRLRRAFHGVDVVIHAAALKRIEVGHYNPLEMVKTNVMGAVNVVEAAIDAGVKKVILLSTDKAYQPISPYGISKAMAEAIFLSANNMTGENPPHFSVTRYGNVAGSRGSVIPLWRDQAKKTGGKVTVTDPDCTRFWMTMNQAVSLVYDTMMTMKGGELVIPDLPAFSVGDLAAAMGYDYEVTGLSPWEKKDESMDSTRCSATTRRMSVDELRTEVDNV